MSGGTISGNSAASGSGIGGGVFTNGTFTMSGGAIYGKGAGTGLANTASLFGASLCCSNAIAKYGNGSNIIASGLYTDETLVGHK
jgi:hypothetical protein